MGHFVAAGERERMRSCCRKAPRAAAAVAYRKQAVGPVLRTAELDRPAVTIETDQAN